ncbi:hexokinase type 2 [Drosophila kikkawai]|uniref:Phosphotransferase n=1 Tax=Drosophila kikkawai TaxID=30033 RepID=A0A6P4HSZ2_DROKI|nr:hexokinase type 2 [Drosophila kikkawai]
MGTINHPDLQLALKDFLIEEEKLTQVVYRMTKEMKMGLSKETHARAAVKCFVTYVQDLPTGKERGKFLALDLGGSNFRVLLVIIRGDSDLQTESRTYVFPETLMTGTAKELFDFITECLVQFCRQFGLENEGLPLGFTFSFPCHQQGLSKGTLVAWTKGFRVEGVVGRNVVELLQEAITRRGEISVTVVALINDTVGTLLSTAYFNNNCRIGLIVGTGTNACYVEKTVNAECFEGYQTSPKPYMVINTEWGAFGDNGVLEFVRTPYDKVIDKETVNPGRQTFEKCISGMYMGEMVRLILIDMMAKGVMFRNESSEKLLQRGSFSTSYISDIESDAPGEYRMCNKVLHNLGLRGNQESDRLNLRYICEAVSSRSAKLCACGLVTLINKMNINEVAIAVDGSVYRYHPTYPSMLEHHMKKLLKPGVKFELVCSEDGSGRGAALAAATTVKNK